jgi:penicillin-binding protein 1A
MAETEQTAGESFSYRIRREAHGVVAWCRQSWREKPWFRWASIALLGLATLWLLVWLLLARGLPDAETLLDYEPPLPTVVRGVDGEIVHSYARERRVQLQYKDFPAQLVNAYTSAEDETFWTHGGVDITGTLNAVFDYATKIGSGSRAVGGSTITQQVAKNILLGNEYSVTRKLKEMILARRIEGVLTKREIMELYLNEIPLGRRSFGVQAASRAYFDKDVGDLKLPEMAFLAILPKAPEKYGRAANVSEAIARRNFVLDVMAENGHITEAQAAEAKAQPLGLVRPAARGALGRCRLFPGGSAPPADREVRRAGRGRAAQRLRRRTVGAHVARYEDADRGSAGATRGADPVLRRPRMARPDRHDRFRQGRPDRTARLEQHRHQLRELARRRGHRARRRFGDDRICRRERGAADRPARRDQGRRRHRCFASGNAWAVRTVPEVQGGFLAEDPNTGRVLAMQGGFDFRLSDFNRATQAQRQPGSTIKPFVYATGLDEGMTPATMVPDQTYCVYQGQVSAKSASATSAVRVAASIPCAGGSSSRAT